ncbi:hypothetical protein CC86DRAFT_424530 [Ophiobolus disseminans]|uniref:Uncharacterized protein n=1 Tax=Ophiobolus disseminans TaxID=1469910 RepID=A0A6A7AHK6_9PLEO|nr:hypothetical protein CC86DRAFT_424530 [Ophiobolus disseminans]
MQQDPLPPGGFRMQNVSLNGARGINTTVTSDGSGLPGEPISGEELIREAKEKSSSIYCSFHTLEACLDRYEDVENGDQSGATDRNIYMWPHVNLEDLLPPTTLLRFLNSRGRNPPGIFAAMDWDSIQIDRETWAIVERQAEDTYNIDLDTIDSTKYGTLRPANGGQYRVTKGLLILEVQDCLMTFLVKVCQGILHDKQLDRESLNRASGIGRLRWAMREDPSFSVDVVGDWSEHSSSRVLLAGRRTHPDHTTPARKKHFWDQTFSTLTTIVAHKGDISKRGDLDPRDSSDFTSTVHQLKDYLPHDVLAMELNRLVQHDKSQKDRVTPMVARFFADLGMAYELRARLKMLCPELFELKDPDEREAIKWLSADSRIIVLYELKMIAGPSHAGEKFLRLADLGEPTKLPYPVNKKRTKNNVETMQATEQRLDELWDKYDAHLEKHLKPETDALLQSAMPTRGELRRTPDWVEPEVTGSKVKRAVESPEYITPSDFGSKSEAPMTLPIRKGKLKPKGTNVEPPTTDQQPHEQIPHETTSSHPMSAISFQPEKLYGSVWCFTPKDGDVFGTETPINFHEPHPVIKLPFRTARLYGRRLTRRYGIDGDCFALN